MSEYVEYIFLAIIQGITEFLPVSSSGHIEFLKHIFDNPSIQKDGAFITVILHLATALSIIIVYRKKIKELLFINNKKSRIYILNILISIIPVAFLVLLNLDQTIENKYNEGWNLMFIAGMFFLTALILFVTEKINVKTQEITWKTAFIIGIFQAVAILPGISRSGTTICVALLLGTSKKESSTFSFLICLPIILGKSFQDIIGSDIIKATEFNLPILIAFVFTFFIGLFCCKWMIKIVNQSKLKYFGLYCFCISISAFLFNFFS